MLLSVGVLTGCQSFTGFDFDSDAIVGGGAVAGKDYITGLKPSLKAREYFVKSNANASQKKTVTPGNDQGTGVVWTDDGGIVIPPGCSIEFENKGYCLDPHLPAPGAGHEMQFVRTASLIPEELQGTYRNLLKRSAAGDEDVKNNMQRLVWALRTAGSQDVMATHLTERQREILSECAENGSFEDYVYRHEMYGKIVEELKSKFVNKIKDSTSVRVGNVVYDAFDLLDPDKGKQKVEAHLQSLISMGLNLPVTQTGFNYGELENGIFTDIKGTGTLSFKAKIANSTSQPYTFYPMNYAAQVGSGGSSVGFYAAANSGMCQRGTCGEQQKVEVSVCEHDWGGEQCVSSRDVTRLKYENEIEEERNHLRQQVRNMDRKEGYEYGSIIYLQDGTIKSTPIIPGSLDYEINTKGRKLMAGLLGVLGSKTKCREYAEPIGRTIEIDGKYYPYDANNNVDRTIAYDTPNGPFSGHAEPSASWPAGQEINKLPADAIPLEIYHDHPDGSGFSEQDKKVAEENGVNISLSNDLYRPAVRFVCSKCGATR